APVARLSNDHAVSVVCACAVMPSIAAAVKNLRVFFMVGFDLLIAIVLRCAGFFAIEPSLFHESATNRWRASHVYVTSFRESAQWVAARKNRTWASLSRSTSPCSLA